MHMCILIYACVSASPHSCVRLYVCIQVYLCKSVFYVYMGIRVFVCAFCDSAHICQWVAPKAMPPVVLSSSTTSEADVGCVAPEVEQFRK